MSDTLHGDALRGHSARALIETVVRISPTASRSKLIEQLDIPVFADSKPAGSASAAGRIVG